MPQNKCSGWFLLESFVNSINFWLWNENFLKKSLKTKFELKLLIDFPWKLSSQSQTLFFVKNFLFEKILLVAVGWYQTIYLDRFKPFSCWANASSLLTKRFRIFDVGISLLESCEWEIKFHEINYAIHGL